MPSFDFFFIFVMFNGKEEGGGGVEVLHVSTRFPALTIFFFGKEIKQGFRR